MRNLKRALSLALASVMLLGMMVVGTSAASYPDVDESKNVEAIEVLNAVNVMIGRQGNFEPDELVNRHEMAVIMAKLYLGVEIADNYVGTHPFTDVVPWADKYVAACYENGLIAGKSATTYNGGDDLTAVQAAAMMLRALGYKDLNKGYQGDWRAPITAMANQIRLFDGVASNPNETLNRNQVAQLALNTLKSPVVNLKDNTISWTNGDGQIIMTGGDREYIVRSSNEAYAQAINRTEWSGTSASQIGGYTVELGEHLYNGKLQLRDTTDVFGRPARHWEYDGKVIGDYAKEELLVKKYNDKEGQSKVTGKDLYDLLSSDVLDDYKLIVHVDGVDDPKIVDSVKLDPNRNTSIVFDKVDLNRNNKAAVGATGTGVQTEVYVDHIKHEIYVAIINTYLAIADKDYDTKKEETPLTIYGVAQETKLGSNEYVKLKGDKEPYKVGVEEFAIAADMAKNDSFLVTLADQEIQSIVPAEVVSGATLSAFKLGDHVVSGGTDYTYTTTATFDADSLDKYTGNGTENLKDRTYDIYLDAYGNLIGLKEIESKKNYVFISGLDRNSSNMVNRIATANAIFLDGTSDTISINMNKSEWVSDFNNQNTEGEALLNTWCTYTKSGDIYTVKEVYSAGSSSNLTGAKAGTSQFHQTGTTVGREADKEFEINLKNLRLDGGGNSSDGFRYVYGDSDSVYLTAEMGELRSGDTKGSYGIIKGAETVSTGIIDTSITVWNNLGARDAANAENDVKTQTVDLAERVAQGIYTLYDKDGTIIAVMAVGEGSAAKDLVYVHTDALDLESDNGNSSRAAGDGLWTWTRRVIRDGQEVTLSEVGDASEELIKMEQYKWYEVRTDGNGDVIKVTRADAALGTTGRDRFVTDYTKINDTVELDNVSTVLYETAGGPTKVDVKGNYIFDDGFGQTNKETLVVKGNNTLAVNTKDGSGIHFRNDVNVVLQYWNRNTKEIDIMSGEGVDDLKDMVSIVNDITTGTDRYNDGVKKTYYVSALIENGLATDIVIFDSYNTYNRPGRPVTPTGDAELKWNDVDMDNQYWDLFIPADEYHANMTTAEIAYWLAKAGCSDISKTRIGWNFTRNGMDYTDQAVKVSPKTTTVTVTYSAGGTASVNKPDAKVGDTVTVNYTPNNGYELDYITVDGVEITSNTFEMTVIPTKVYVAFKETAAPAGSVKVTTPAGGSTVLVSDPTKAITSAKKGDVIAVLPSQALEIKAGATLITEGANKGFYTVDGDKDIAVTVKTGWGYNPTQDFWMGKIDGVNSFLPGVKLGGVAASMFRMAREAVNIGGAWLKEAMTDEEHTYTLSVGSYNWVGVLVPGNTSLDPKAFQLQPDAATAAAGQTADDALLEAWKNDTYTVDKTENDKPVDPAELVELVANDDKTAYTVNYYVTKPAKSAIADKIKADKAAYSAEWARNGSSDSKLNVRYAKDGAIEEVTVTWVANTAVHYKDTIIGYVVKDAATKAYVGKGTFNKDSVVIGGEKGIVASTTLPTNANGVQPKFDEDMDDYYIYDAIGVTVGSGLTVAQYKNEKGNKVSLTGVTAVVENTVLYLTGTAGHTPGDKYSLTADDEVLETNVATAAAAAYEVTVAKTMDADKDGGIDFDEVPAVDTYTVILGDEKETGKDGDTVTIKAKANAAYILKNDGIVHGTAKVVANSKGVLKYTIDSSDADTGKTTITLQEACKFNFDSDTVAPKAIITKVDAYNASDVTGVSGEGVDFEAITNGHYVVVGKTVVITSATAKIELKSDAVTLHKEEGLTISKGDKDNETYVYSFAMPGDAIAADDIKAGDAAASLTIESAGGADDKQTAMTASADPDNDLSSVDGSDTAVLTLTGAGATTTLPKAEDVITWVGNADGTKPGDAPANLTYKIEDANPTTPKPGEWAVNFKTAKGEIVPAGTYWFRVTVGELSVVCKLVVANPTVADGAGLKGVLESDLNADVTLDTADTDVEGLEIGVDQKVTAGATLSLKGETKVAGVLTLKDAVTEGSEPATIKLEGGKIVLDTGDQDALPDLAKGSKGTIDLKGNDLTFKGVSDAGSDAAKMSALAAAVDAPSKSVAATTSQTVEVKQAGVQFNKDATGVLTGFSSNGVNTYGNLFEDSKTLGLYEFKLTGLTSSDKINAERKMANGKTVAVTGFTDKNPSEDEGKAETFLLLEGNEVHEVIFTITHAAAPGGTAPAPTVITFKIG